MADIIKLIHRTSPVQESPIIRFSPDLEEPISSVFGMETPAALFTRTIETYGDKRCLAFRKIIAHVAETRLLGDWQYYTFTEVGQRVKEMSAGLKKLLTGRKLQRLHMSAPNSANWFMLSHAAAMANIELICINTKLGQRELTHSIANVPATAVYACGEFISRLLTPLVECPHVKLIIYDTTSEVEEDIQAMRNEVNALRIGLGHRIKIMSVQELCTVGLEVMEDISLEKPKDKERIWGWLYPRTLNEFELPTPDSVTNGQVAAGFAGLYHALQPGIFKDDTYLSYLPLYFRLEYNLVNAFFMSGLTVGYGTDLDRFLLSTPFNPIVCPASYGDTQSFNPSILFGIKVWWDVIHEKLLKTVSARPIEEQNNFWKYLEKKRDVRAGRHPPLANIFEKWGHIAEIRSSFFGERIRWIGITCSMFTPEQREFLGLVFGGTRGIMVEGWTLPHINSDVTFMPPHLHSRTGLGRPLPSIELKLVSEGDEDVNHGRHIYRGHIFIRGPSLSRVAAISLPLSGSENTPLSREDDWVKTNRIGEWNTQKQSFHVIGHLLEPLTARYLGDYVPLERLEGIYRQISYVHDCVLLHSWKSVHMIGIINVDEAALRLFAATHSLVLADRAKLKTEVIKDLWKEGHKRGLVGFELVAGIVLGFEQWDKKLRFHDGSLDRDKVISKYRGEVEEEAIREQVLTDK